MNADKWRIRKDPRFGNQWVVFAPGSHIRAAFKGRSQGHCVAALPYLYRIDLNTRILRRGL